MPAYLLRELDRLTAPLAVASYQRSSRWVLEAGPLGWIAASMLIGLTAVDYFFNVKPRRIVNPLPWTAACGASVALGLIGLRLNDRSGILAWIGTGVLWLVGVAVFYMYFAVRNGRYGG
jgi:hypothetical protein